MTFVHSTIASFDGTPLAVHVRGPAHAPVLLLANGAGATASAYRFIIERFADAFRFVSWDYRGLYASGRPVRGYPGLNVSDHAQDALAIVDALEVESFHALGWSMGVQVLLEAHRTAAARFLTLVLHNGGPGKTRDALRDADGALPARQRVVRRLVDPLLRAAQRADGLVERAFSRAIAWPRFLPLAIRAGLVHHDVDRATFMEAARGFTEVDMHLFLEMLRRVGRHDASDMLVKVRCPTLVLQGSEDKVTSLAAAARMAGAIAGAKLVVLPGGTHFAAIEMPALLNEHLEKFWAPILGATP